MKKVRRPFHEPPLARIRVDRIGCRGGQLGALSLLQLLLLHLLLELLKLPLLLPLKAPKKLLLLEKSLLRWW